MNKIPRSEYPTIAERRKRGDTLQDIADTYNSTRERVRQILKEHFPEIKTKNIFALRRKMVDKEENKKTKLCACGCGTVIPARRKDKNGYWCRARSYVPGHIDPKRRKELRNRITHPQHMANATAGVKRGWKEGKYRSVGPYWESEEVTSKFRMFVKLNPGCSPYRIFRKARISPSAVSRLIERHCTIEKAIQGGRQKYAVYLRENAQEEI